METQENKLEDDEIEIPEEDRVETPRRSNSFTFTYSYAFSPYIHKSILISSMVHLLNLYNSNDFCNNSMKLLICQIIFLSDNKGLRSLLIENSRGKFLVFSVLQL